MGKQPVLIYLHQPKVEYSEHLVNHFKCRVPSLRILSIYSYPFKHRILNCSNCQQTRSYCPYKHQFSSWAVRAFGRSFLRPNAAGCGECFGEARTSACRRSMILANDAWNDGVPHRKHRR